MLISNGSITRNIDPSQLNEYVGKGYKEVKPAPKKAEPKAEPKKVKK